MSVYAGHHPYASRRSEAEHRETMQFKLFALLVILLNSGLLILAWLNSSGASPSSPLEFLIWVALVAMAGLVPLNSGRGPALAMDLPLLLAAAFSFGPSSSGLIALLGAADVREFRHEISFLRAIWNRSQTSLSVMSASVVFSLIGGLGVWPRTPIAGLAALAMDASVNYVIVGIGTSLRTGSTLGPALRAMRIGSPFMFVLTYACFGFLGILIAEAYLAFGALGLLASVAPVVLGRQAFAHRSRLDDVERSLAESSTALRRVDERIAEERLNERNRIAAALHDEVLQDLYNVTIRAQVLRQDLVNGRLLDLEDDLPPVITASEAAVEDLREVIQGLRSASVGHAGLVETLALFAHHVEEDSGVQVVRVLDPTVRLSPERALVVYQIAREALSNAARHSTAKTVWLSLAPTSVGWEVVVEDHGCGFASAASHKPLHFGLKLMRERADSIGADLEIRSAPGSGTVVRLNFDAEQ